MNVFELKYNYSYRNNEKNVYASYERAFKTLEI